MQQGEVVQQNARTGDRQGQGTGGGCHAITATLGAAHLSLARRGLIPATPPPAETPAPRAAPPCRGPESRSCPGARPPDPTVRLELVLGTRQHSGTRRLGRGVCSGHLPFPGAQRRARDRVAGRGPVAVAPLPCGTGARCSRRPSTGRAATEVRHLPSLVHLLVPRGRGVPARGLLPSPRPRLSLARRN